MPLPILIPMQHLNGFNVWIGNDLAGEVWTDRTGHRWNVRWSDHNRRFKFGLAGSIADCVKMVVKNYEP